MTPTSARRIVSTFLIGTIGLCAPGASEPDPPAAGSTVSTERPSASPDGVETRRIAWVEFVDQPIGSILTLLSAVTDVPIRFDDTVDGRVSATFRDVSLVDALDHILLPRRIYYSVDERGVFVSRAIVTVTGGAPTEGLPTDGSQTEGLRVEGENPEGPNTDEARARSRRYSIDCDEFPLNELLRRLSIAVGETIVADDAAETTITLHERAKTRDEILNIIADLLADHVLLGFAPPFRFVPRDHEQANLPQPIVTGTDDGIEINAESVDLGTALAALSDATGMQIVYGDLSRVSLRSVRTTVATFEEAVAALLLGLPYEVVPADGADLVVASTIAAEGGASRIESYQPAHRAPDALVRALPAEIRSSAIATAHDERIILYGTPGEVARAGELLAVLDAPIDKTTIVYRFVHADAEDAVAILPRDLRSDARVVPSTNTIVLEVPSRDRATVEQMLRAGDVAADLVDVSVELHQRSASDALQSLPAHLRGTAAFVIAPSNRLVVRLSRDREAELRRYIDLFDRRPHVEFIRLNRLTPEEAIASLPSTIIDGNLHSTGDPNTLLWTGSREHGVRVRRLLGEIDRPGSRFVVDLLLVEHHGGSSLTWELGGSAASRQPGVQTFARLDLDRVLALSIDVPTLFGYTFAARLNSAIADSEASVLLDTSFRVHDGEEGSFENTTTYRYAESQNSDAGITTTIREIESGIVVATTATDAPDGRIALIIEAEISKYRSELASAGTPAPTSRKRISHHLVLDPGQPERALSIAQVSEEAHGERPGILGWIPLLGRVFGRSERDEVQSALAIYVVARRVDDTPSSTWGWTDALDRLLSTFGDSTEPGNRGDADDCGDADDRGDADDSADPAGSGRARDGGDT